jgi:isopenicillin N synthase-like dioxygenase
LLAVASLDDIPIIDGAVLAGSPGRERDAADASVERACRDSGFMVLVPPPGDARLDAARRRRLLSVFDLPAASKRSLHRQRFAAANRNRYRGLAPMSPGSGIFTENLDVGPDVVTPNRGRHPGRPTRDVLVEASVWPGDDVLPGWRDEAARTFAGFESLGIDVVSSIERALGIEPGRLTRHFVAGNSTLKLARHPEPGEWDGGLCERLAVTGDQAGAGGARSMQLVLPHVDSGCVTFVGQDRGGGLQARARDGSWADVPHEPGWLAVNFGRLIERWTGGSVRATEHRVIGTARRRTALAFFYEPAVDARIEPVFESTRFEPFAYGDYVWERMQQFPDYQDLGARFSDEAAPLGSSSGPGKA